MAMYRQGKTHSPIIMQSVKSTQVQKPVLQMAGLSLQGPPPRLSWWDLSYLVDLAYYLVDMVSYQGDLESFPVVVLTVALPPQSQCLLLHHLMR